MCHAHGRLISGYREILQLQKELTDDANELSADKMSKDTV